MFSFVGSVTLDTGALPTDLYRRSRVIIVRRTSTGSRLLALSSRIFCTDVYFEPKMAAEKTIHQYTSVAATLRPLALANSYM